VVVLELGELVVLVDARLGEVGVHGDARDEDVALDVILEQLGVAFTWLGV
jgi:hypothetical protein